MPRNDNIHKRKLQNNIAGNRDIAYSAELSCLVPYLSTSCNRRLEARLEVVFDEKILFDEHE